MTKLYVFQRSRYYRGFCRGRGSVLWYHCDADQLLLLPQNRKTGLCKSERR